MRAVRFAWRRRKRESSFDQAFEVALDGAVQPPPRLFPRRIHGRNRQPDRPGSPRAFALVPVNGVLAPGQERR